MTQQAKTLQAILFDGKSLKVLDQLLLPHRTEYIEVCNVQDGWQVINKMQVRGAPAIAIVGICSLAVHLQNSVGSDINELVDYLITSRPTAVNLREACNRLKSLLSGGSDVEVVGKFAQDLLANDLLDNRRIGENGSNYLASKIDGQFKVLTHCNTGSLATSGYGTALGVIRSLHSHQKLQGVYCTETRPYNQGSRLTAYELVVDGLPEPTLICDSMASALLRQGQVKAIIVGADRIARNGDTANKIGTYQLAITARYHGVLFVVAAPTSTIDFDMADGQSIEIEERRKSELINVTGLTKEGNLGSVCIAPQDINVWNPAFDVTPSNLIDAIVTETQVYLPVDGVFKLQPLK